MHSFGGGGSATEGGVSFFELSLFSPDMTLIATVRRFVSDLCTRAFDDDDITSRVVVATHELLDNAVRYSSRDASGIRVELQRVGDEVDVHIITRNRFDEAHGRELERLLDEMRASSDRATFYQTLIRRVAKRSENGSGLGLGRVHAEAELDLDSRFDTGIVHICAEGRFPLRTGATPR
jgi:hypothetical protein